VVDVRVWFANERSDGIEQMADFRVEALSGVEGESPDAVAPAAEDADQRAERDEDKQRALSE